VYWGSFKTRNKQQEGNAFNGHYAYQVLRHFDHVGDLNQFTFSSNVRPEIADKLNMS
jgi:hypothetical protein